MIARQIESDDGVVNGVTNLRYKFVTQSILLLTNFPRRIGDLNDFIPTLLTSIPFINTIIIILKTILKMLLNRKFKTIDINNFICV